MPSSSESKPWSGGSTRLKRGPGAPVRDRLGRGDRRRPPGARVLPGLLRPPVRAAARPDPGRARRTARSPGRSARDGGQMLTAVADGIQIQWLLDPDHSDTLVAFDFGGD